MSFLSIPLWCGRLNLKRTEDRLFSERYDYIPNICIGPLCVSYVKYREFNPYPPVAAASHSTSRAT